MIFTMGYPSKDCFGLWISSSA